MRTYSNKVKSVLSAGVLSAAALSSLAACGSGGDEGEQTAYCADENGRIIDEDYCDDDDHDGHGGGFIFIGGFGGNHYSAGQTIPQKYRSGPEAATRVRANDSAARAKAGLPKTGTVKSGTAIKGGIGTGSVGKGGSSGG